MKYKSVWKVDLTWEQTINTIAILWHHSRKFHQTNWSCTGDPQLEWWRNIQLFFMGPSWEGSKVADLFGILRHKIWEEMEFYQEWVQEIFLCQIGPDSSARFFTWPQHEEHGGPSGFFLKSHRGNPTDQWYNDTWPDCKHARGDHPGVCRKSQ